MNLIGYMLAKLSWHSDSLVESMLQKMLLNLDNTEEDSDESDNENGNSERKLLVFKDFTGQIWQISKANDLNGFDALLDDNELDVTNYFKPNLRPFTFVEEQLVPEQVTTARIRLEEEEGKAWLNSVRTIKKEDE